MTKNDKSIPSKAKEISDEFFRLRIEKAKLEAEIKGLDKEAGILEAKLREVLDAHDLDSIKTEAGSHKIETKLFAKIEDFDEFFEWVKKTGSTEFLSKRVNVSPVRAMVAELNTLPPGIGSEMITKVASRINPTFKSKVLAS
jgi:hypothetical protein